MYAIHNKALLTQKCTVLPFVIKTLMRNVEVIKILNRFSYCINYRKNAEIDAAIPIQKISSNRYFIPHWIRKETQVSLE